MMYRIKVIAAVLALVACFAVTGRFEHHYYLSGVVVDVSDSVVIIEDTQHECWRWDDEGGKYQIGDTVCMRMFDNFTDSISDDEIEVIR